jgi:hypothetical protein
MEPPDGGLCRKMIKNLRKMAFSNGLKTGKINKSLENKKIQGTQRRFCASLY